MPEDTTDRTAKLFAMFKVAIEDERRAQKMYRDILRVCHDEVMNEVVEGLLRDEVGHEQKLLGEYRRLRDLVGGGDDGPASPAPR